MTKPLTKEQKAKNAADRMTQGKLAITPTKQKLTGFNGEVQKATTPLQVQEAANGYFDAKLQMERVKEKIDLARECIASEMRAVELKTVIVRNADGEPTIMHMKTSSKLEIKKIKG